MRPAAERYGIDFSRPRVMTIINVTPDSFYEASRTFDEEQIVARVREAVADGCDLVDIGGYSSRPGAADVAVDEEIRRVELGIACVRAVSADIPISVDTFRSAVATRALMADDKIIINDISAGEGDPAMFGVAAEAEVPYIAMHMRGTPATMNGLTEYEDVVCEVVDYLRRRVDAMLDSGVRAENIMLDPGFGFAKTVEQNYRLLSNLRELCATGFPVVVGVSRKSMIYKVLDSSPEETLAGTAALHWEALRQGAAVLRVHDTRAAADTVKIFNEFQKDAR